MLSVRPLFRLLVLVCFTFLITSFAAAQDPTQITDGINVGLPENGVFDGSDFDTIQVTNGKLHVEVPLYSSKGRGLDMYVKFIYDAPSYWDNQITNNQGYVYDRYKMTAGGGWRIATPASFSLSTQFKTMGVCPVGSGSRIVNTSITLTEPDGTKHHFVPDQVGLSCYTNIAGGVMYADDGSGWMLKVDPTTGNPNINSLAFDAIRKDGAEITSAYNSTTQTTTLTLKDSNGNQITEASTPTTRSVTDTLNRTLAIPVFRNLGQYQFSYADSNGAAQTIGFTIGSLPLSTNFCNPPSAFCTDFSGSGPIPTQIVLPNGLQYTFTPGTGFGKMLSATLPTGGQIAWTWQAPSNPFDPYNPQITMRTVTANGQQYTRNYAYGTYGTYPVSVATTVTDAANNDTRYTLSLITSQAPAFYSSGLDQVSKVEYFTGSATSGTLLKTVATDYSNAATVLPVRDTTTWAQTNQVSKVETDWDSYNTGQVTVSWRNPINRREYDFGAGTLLRTTSFNYLHLANSSYLAANIANKPASQIVYEADGTTVHSKTLYTYDGTTITGTSGVVSHDYTNFSSSRTVRGNATLIQRWRNTDNALLTTTNFYNDLGKLIQTQDPGGHNTYFDYTDSWSNSACAPASGTTQAFVTKATNALTQTTKTQYASCTSLVGSATDLNNLTTTYQYDAMGRLIQKNTPDGGQTTVSYGASLPINNVTTTKINSSQNLVSTTVLDDLGRVKQVQVNSDPQGVAYTDTTFDALGRVSTVSNPYRAGTDPTTTSGITTYGYDALSRKITQTYPDNSVVTTAYCGPSTLVTDPTGKWRRSRTDGLGRLVEVDEPNAPGASIASTGCPGTGEPIWVTSYTNDVLGNLTQVVQNGSHQRNFTYDSLSRLLTSSNPEAGTITYKYDSDANCTAPNSFTSLLVSKTDARGIRTCSQYDALNRETVRNYSNGDPTITTTYDQANCLGLSSCANIGQRTGITDAAGSESWSYDVVNRIHKDQRITNSITKSTTYNLDLAGNITSVVYPTGGRTVNYAYDAANRPSTASDGSNGITYATDFQTAPTGCLAGKVCYTPQGTFYALSIGQSASFTGLNLTHSYNNRLQPLQFKASSTGGNSIDITYSFVDPTTSKNAGHVYSITNNLNSSRTQNFTYDQLNRIKTAGTSATTGPYCWGYDYSSSYDAWGNLQSQPGATAYTGCTEYLPPAMTADGNNHLSGFGYDLSGNTTGDGVNSYAWNAESQLKVTAGSTYIYDGDGRRVAKANTATPPVPYKLYWYGSGGEILAETDASGNNPNEYIFFGGQRVAMLPANSTPIFYVEDLLGTSRVTTTNTGVVCYDADFYPYGGERSYTNTCSQNNYKFEGKERDTETGNDDFGARYYSNRFGRWLSADWSSIPVPVPYANLTNPQTLNLYSMVADDPESFADLDGHQGTAAGNTAGQSDGLCKEDPANCKPSQPAQAAANAAQAQEQSGAQRWEAQQQVTPEKMANALVQAGKMGDAGVKAGLAVVGAEGAVAGAVVAAPAVAAAGSQAATAINTAATSAYVQATTALSAAGAAIQNGYQSAVNLAKQAVVTVDTLRSGGGAINAARDFVQAATSNRTPPAPNKFGAAGLAVKVAIKLLFP